ncbi:MAG TPA: hypothetical protein PK239_08890 [Chitinophagales bacterium]|nr:hypothetical protein [Chitinophagales bacterium]
MNNTEKPLIIISTVGTSLFTNYMQDSNDSKFQKFWDKDLVWCDYNDKKNEPNKDNGRKIFEEEIWKKIQEQQQKTESFADKIGKWIIKKGCETSAELKSITQIVGSDEKSKVIVHLLTTSSFDGHLCGWILKKELKNQGYIHVHLKRIEGLTIDSGTNFQTTALNELAKYVNEYANDNTILNITGGYKALIPFMTIIGQIKGFQLKYIYEDSNDLIPVGNLPINFDWEIAQATTQYLKISTAKKDEPDNSEILTQEPKIIELLKTNGIAHQNTELVWKVSGLGTFLVNYIKDKSEVAKGTLGLFLEYKFYEYIYETEDLYYAKPKKLDLEYFVNENTYKIFDMKDMRLQYPNHVTEENTHSEINRRPKDIDPDLETMEEIDFVLELRKDSTKKVVCEIKSYDKLGKVSNQLKKDIMAYHKKFACYPDELAVLFYKVKFVIESDTDFSTDRGLNQKIQSINNELCSFFKDKNICPIPLRIMGTHVNLTNSFKVDYKTLLRKHLNPQWVFNEPPQTTS